MKSISLLFFIFISLNSIAGIDENLVSTKDNSELGIKNNEFNLLVWATNEVAAKECKSESELPRSFYLWRDMSLRYAPAMKRHELTFQKSIEELKNSINAMTNNQNGMDLQTDSLVLQLASMDSLLALFREKLTTQTSFGGDEDFSYQNAVIENKKWIDAFENFSTLGLKKSIEIAKKACDEKPPIKNCDKANEILSSISNSDILELKKEYDKKLIESKIDIEKIKKIESQITNKINSLPDGSSGYNWRNPITEENTKLIEVRKKIGISCSNSKDSKSLNEINKLISILEDKKLTDIEKNEQIAKGNLPLPNLNADSFSTAELLKKLPTTWDKMNQQLAVGLDRIDLQLDIKNRFEELKKLESKEIQQIQDKRAAVAKLLLNVKNLTNYKINIESLCPDKNFPHYVIICPDPNNPYCDQNSKEYFEYHKYQLCQQRMTNLNKEIESISNTSEAIRNDPNLVGIEGRSFGIAGVFYQAKIQNPDGTITYKGLGEGAPQTDPCSGGFVAGPVAGPCPATTPPITPNSSTPKVSNSSAPVIAPKTSASKTPSKSSSTPPKAALPTKPAAKTAKDFVVEFQDKLKKTSANIPASSTKECGAKPISSDMYVECPSKKPNPWCDPYSKERQQLEKFNGCVTAVNNHNEIIDGQLNLSSYLKNNKEYQSIVKSPDTGILMAKMIRENGEIYYLPLDFDPEKNK